MQNTAAAVTAENGDQVTVLPPATKAAMSRARKARQGSDGKADGAKTVHLNAEEDARGKKYDEEDARKKYLEKISDDALYIATTVKGFAALCHTADKAVEARDEYFSQKMKIPEFADRIQRVRDWASTKRNNEFLTIDGKEYKSVKVFFKQELGYSYEYIHRQCKKMQRLDLLLADAPPPTLPVDRREADRHKAEVACEANKVKRAAAVAAQQPMVEILSVHGFDTSFSLAEKVQSAFNSVVDCTVGLTATEIDEFYEKLIAKLLNESQREKI